MVYKTSPLILPRRQTTPSDRFLPERTAQLILAYEIVAFFPNLPIAFDPFGPSLPSLLRPNFPPALLPIMTQHIRGRYAPPPSIFSPLVANAFFYAMSVIPRLRRKRSV
jgi:hypothetical protein